MFDDYYSGCTLLKPLSDRVGIPIDRVSIFVFPDSRDEIVRIISSYSL